jgi:hypothetical protein
MGRQSTRDEIGIVVENEPKRMRVRVLPIQELLAHKRARARDQKLSSGAGRFSLNQLDTNRIECCEFSSTAAAILPKYSVSPAGRPTPITTRS